MPPNAQLASSSPFQHELRISQVPGQPHRTSPSRWPVRISSSLARAVPRSTLVSNSALLVFPRLPPFQRTTSGSPRMPHSLPLRCCSQSIPNGRHKNQIQEAVSSTREYTSRCGEERYRRLDGPVRERSLTAHSADGETTPEDGREPEEPVSVKSSRSPTAEVLLGASVSIFLGVTNRVLYKMALVPLSKYPFFLAQLTTFGYVIVYFLLLWVRFKSGIVTKEMLSIPKARFAAMGFLEALGLALGMAAASFLPGTMVTILSQTFLAWQLLFSSVILKRRYSIQQLVGCSMVVGGVVAAIALSGPSAGSTVVQSSGLLWPAVLILSGAFPACSSIIKEGVFLDAAKRFPGTSLDIFVVNSFGSGFQALFVFLLLPILSWIGLRIPLSELPAYFQEGSACLLNMGQPATNCEGAPLLPLLYIAANLAFNISILSLLKKSSAVVVSLSLSIAVPLTIATFSLPLPFLGQPQHVGWGFLGGAALLVAGLFVYNSTGMGRKTMENSKTS